jgi:hypothetical protein
MGLFKKKGIAKREQVNFRDGVVCQTQNITMITL